MCHSRGVGAEETFEDMAGMSWKSSFGSKGCLLARSATTGQRPHVAASLKYRIICMLIIVHEKIAQMSHKTFLQYRQQLL